MGELKNEDWRVYVVYPLSFSMQTSKCPHLPGKIRLFLLFQHPRCLMFATDWPESINSWAWSSHAELVVLEHPLFNQGTHLRWKSVCNSMAIRSSILLPWARVWIVPKKVHMQLPTSCCFPASHSTFLFKTGSVRWLLSSSKCKNLLETWHIKMKIAFISGVFLSFDCSDTCKWKINHRESGLLTEPSSICPWGSSITARIL